jgi:hypothetical protein
MAGRLLAQEEEGVQGKTWTITKKGLAALKKGTVDSEAAKPMDWDGTPIKGADRVTKADKAKAKPVTKAKAKPVTETAKPVTDTPKTGTRPDGWSWDPAENRRRILETLYPPTAPSAGYTIIVSAK